ncbi:MAG: AtpZ/AtpI family protein [Cyclobacteriaceae bacterium]
MDNPNRRKNQSDSPQKAYKDYAKYSGLAFQMAGLIFLGYWLGDKLDDLTDSKFPLFKIILMLLFTFASLYSLIKSLPKE